MKSPFRKLVRISVVLLVLVLLFNFFGYYINRIRSLENKELIEAINRSGHQQSLSQRIAKEAILLLNNPEDSTASTMRGVSNSTTGCDTPRTCHCQHSMNSSSLSSSFSLSFCSPLVPVVLLLLFLMRLAASAWSSSESTPYEKAAARVPPPEKARPTSRSSRPSTTIACR